MHHLLSTFLLSLEGPGYRTLLQVTCRGHCGESCQFLEPFFYIFVTFPKKQYLLINQNLTFLSKSPVKQHLLPLPQWDPYGGCLFPEPSFTHPSGSPVKEPSLQVPLIGPPQRERHPFPEPSFTVS